MWTENIKRAISENVQINDENCFVSPAGINVKKNVDQQAWDGSERDDILIERKFQGRCLEELIQPMESL